jgi:type IX secretion system PorP/SprF family membrane protein
MKKYIAFCIVCLSALVTYSQQLFQQTQFMINPYTLNPALAGSEDFADIKAGYRTQWVGLQDTQGYIDGPIAPRTTYLSAHTSLGHDHSYYRNPRGEHKAFHGIGAFVTSDKLGAYSSNSMYGSYSYNLLLVKSQKTSGQMYGFNGKDRHIGVRMIIGAHVGFYQHIVDGALLNPLDSDPALASLTKRLNKGGPDGSLGTWIYSNNYYIGFAVRRIFASDIKLLNKIPDYNLSRHYNLMGGYKLMLSDLIQFEPSFNIKLESLRTPSVDFNSLLVYDNTNSGGARGGAMQKGAKLHLYVGATYRVESAVAFLLGGVFQRKYEVAYSFDITTTKLGSYQGGTHEVTLGLRIPPKKTLYTAEDKTKHRGVKHH